MHVKASILAMADPVGTLKELRLDFLRRVAEEEVPAKLVEGSH